MQDRAAVIARYEDVLTDPDLLGSFAHAFRVDEPVTLYLYAPGVEQGEALATLSPVIAALGLVGARDASIELLCLPVGSDRQVAVNAAALYSRAPVDGPLGELRVFGPDELPGLRAHLFRERKEHYLSLCTIFKNEEPYLVEWIEFHRLVGAEHFYLYDNNSTDDYRSVLAPYVEAGIATVVEWPLYPDAQVPAYSHCAATYGHRSQWIAFMDVDEFFFVPGGGDLRDRLREYERFGGLGINYVNYGTSGHLQRPDGLVVESYLHRVRDDTALIMPAGLKSPELDKSDVANYHPLNARISSVVQPEHVVECAHPHFWTYKDGYYAVTENCEPVDWAITPTVSVSRLRMNHYWSKSESECFAKITRGDVNRAVGHRWPDEYLQRNAVLNEEVDTSILVYAPALRERLGLPPGPPADALVEESERRLAKSLDPASRYFVAPGYQARVEPAYFDDGDGDEGVVWQPDVYAELGEVARRLGASRLIDVGCGKASKLVGYHPEFELIGLDYGQNIAACRTAYPYGTWIDHDFEQDAPPPLSPEQLRGSVLVVADVLEHLVRPERLVRWLRRALEHAEAILVSTPDRHLTRGEDHWGPPDNPCHVREWTTEELAAFLSAEGFEHGEIGLTRANDRDPKLRTIFAKLVRDESKLPALQPPDKETVAKADYPGVPRPPAGAGSRPDVRLEEQAVVGKVIKELASASVPSKAIFDKRVVVECCETFHLHWRNVRLELSAENWREFLDLVLDADRAWRGHGSPESHEHLELARRLLRAPALKDDEVGAELCENLYKTAPPPFGDDAEFYEDDEFVHFHYRDLRIEMSVEEFLAFSGAAAEARTRLLEGAAPTLAALFARLDAANVVWAVSRNWDNLPGGVEVGPHSDLDLLVHPAHLAVVESLWAAAPTNPRTNPAQRRVPVAGADGSESYVLVDLRAPGDGYFPESFAHGSLARRARHERGFWTLAPRDHFLALSYHVVHHKGVLTDDYERVLAQLAPSAGERLDGDRGDVGQLVAVLDRAGLEFEQPDDPYVLPKLPYVRPVRRVAYSRVLCEHEGMPIQSRVYRTIRNDCPVVEKQTHGDLAAREAAILSRLDSQRFPRVVDVERYDGQSICTLEQIDGLPLATARERLVGESRERFVVGCIEILRELRDAGIVHRDVTARNLLVRDGLPVLIDFGWALADGYELPEALERTLDPALGEDGRPPEGGYCDAYALGVVLRDVVGDDPRYVPLVRALTAPVGQRVRDPDELLRFLDGGAAPTSLERELADLLRRVSA